MRRIDATFNGQEFTFRSNDSGEYLFTGVSVNNQISCESGFNSRRRMKSAIREYLRNQLGAGVTTYPRIQFTPDSHSDWKG
jgi:hypothetical protein